MIFPRLLQSVFRESTYDISHNGLGSLPDAISCEVTEQRNGEFILNMTYPVGGLNWSNIDIGRFIVCKPNVNGAEQPFRIVDISKVANDKIRISAEHISYDINGIVVRGFNASNSVQFGTNLLDNSYDSVGNHSNFSFSTDIRRAAVFVGVYKPPRTMKSLILGSDNSFKTLYGGEISYDGLSIKMNEHRGNDNGIVIHARTNMLSLTQQKTLREFPTAVYPYWYSEGEGYLDLPERVLHFGAAEYSDVEKVIPLDLSEYFSEKPSEEELRNAAALWINENFLSAPKFNLKVSYEDLNGDVNLCDIVSVIYPNFNVSAKYQVVEIKYDVLRDKVNSIVVGDPLPDFSDTILRLSKGVKN